MGITWLDGEANACGSIVLKATVPANLRPSPGPHPSRDRRSNLEESERATMALMVCAIPECYRPRHERGGIVHDFCSRTHAQEAADRGMIDQLRPPHGDCHVRDHEQFTAVVDAHLGWQSPPACMCMDSSLARNGGGFFWPFLRGGKHRLLWPLGRSMMGEPTGLRELNLA